MSAQMARVARIDDDRVYWGLGEPIPLDQVRPGDAVFGAPEIAEALPAGAVYVERDCDLRGGRYRLDPPDPNHRHWHFTPLPPVQQKEAPKTITFERALYDQLKHLHMRDAAAVGANALIWAKQYETSFDADNGRMLGYFRDLDGGAA